MTSQVKWSKVILFGDSLTQHSLEPNDGCWGSLIADKLQRISDVIVRGFSGYNTRWCKTILPQIFPPDYDITDIACFVIFLGANDACDVKSLSHQHVPIDEYTENLIAMVEYLVKIGITKDKIILVSPPVYLHNEFVKYCKSMGRTEPIKDNQTVGEYANACIRAGVLCEVQVLDIYNAFLKEMRAELFIDGLHFSRKGSQLLYQLIWPLIEKRVKSNESQLTMNFPIYSDIDWENHENSLTPKK